MHAALVLWTLSLQLLAPISSTPSQGARNPGGGLGPEASLSCTPGWIPTFGGLPGLDDRVFAATVFDDGGGAALYVGGEFRSAGGVNANLIAKWDGSSWSNLGSGLSTGTSDRVYSMVVHDDGAGGGPVLYVGGDFSTAGGSPANNIARWNGSSWSQMGSGANDWVRALVVHDDGSGGGPALFAAGRFSTIGGVAAQRIAKWDGSSWSPLGSGAESEVRALAVFNDGSGPALFAGGLFTTIGGVAANRVAKWNGSSWSDLGSGTNNAVHALATFDDGSGPALYAGGTFTNAGGVSASRSARWNGATWSGLGGGTGTVNSFTVFDDGTGAGPNLCAGGAGIRRWNGSSWSALGNQITSDVYVLAAFDDGSGAAQRLFAGGFFRVLPQIHNANFARWDGTSWETLQEGLDGSVSALAVHDDGSGMALYAGGRFLSAGGQSANYIARWDGLAWSQVGPGPGFEVRCLAVFDDGSAAGPQLYAGEGLVLPATVRRWDGNAWSTVGAAFDGPLWGASINALLVHDDGSGAGPQLYAGGDFTQAGGVNLDNIARWNGSSWESVGSGTNGSVSSLCVHDDSSGPALFVGGNFSSAGGLTAHGLARWNGSAWSSLGTSAGIIGFAALAVFDDGLGAGSALYAARSSILHRWDGTQLATVAGFDDTVYALQVYDEGAGQGEALFIGGHFNHAGGNPGMNRITRWDGQDFSELGVGLTGGAFTGVHTLGVYDDGLGSGPTLVAGGSFSASPGGDSYIARWGGCVPPVGEPYCFGDGSGTVCPCGNAGGAGEGCANSGGVGAILGALGSAAAASDDLILQAWQLVAGQPALLFVGLQATNQGSGSLFGDGLRCAGGGVRRLGVRTPDAASTASWGPGLGALGGWNAGETHRFQAWYRDPSGSPCGGAFNLSNGLAVTFD